MDDYRIQTSWRTHPKRLMLEAELGPEAVLAVMDLWSFAATSRTDGSLAGMSAKAIALASGWRGDADEFVGLLADLGLLDGDAGVYSLHDWEDHNPYCATHAKRSARAKKASSARWGESDAASNAKRNARSRTEHTAVDAPSPDPDPDPDPYPDPDPAPPDAGIQKIRPVNICKRVAPDGAVADVVEYYCSMRPKKRGGAQNPATIALVKQRLDTHAVADIKAAIDGALGDRWTTEKGLDALSRIVADDDTMERFMTLAEKRKDAANDSPF